MYRVSPFTYWIGGIVGTELHGREIDCSDVELNVFNPPQGTTCGRYLQPFLSQAPGALKNPEATTQCQYCSARNADQILAGSDIFWTERFRNFGIMWAYIVFNVFMAILLYYLFRVKKWNKGSSKSKPQKNREKNVEQKSS